MAKTQILGHQAGLGSKNTTIKCFWYLKQCIVTFHGKTLDSSNRYAVEYCFDAMGSTGPWISYHCKWPNMLPYVLVTSTANDTIRRGATSCKEQGPVRCSVGPSTQGRLPSLTVENISYFSMLWTSGNWRNPGEILLTQGRSLWANLRSTNSTAGSTRPCSPGRPNLHFC